MHTHILTQDKHAFCCSRLMTQVPVQLVPTKVFHLGMSLTAHELHVYFTVSSFYNSKEAILLHKDQPIGTGIYLTSVDGKLSTLLMAAINIVIIIQKCMAVWPSLCTSQKIHLRWTFLNLLSPIRPQEGRKKTTFQNCKYVSLSQLYNCLFCIANRRMMYFYGRRQR